MAGVIERLRKWWNEPMPYAGPCEVCRRIVCECRPQRIPGLGVHWGMSEPMASALLEGAPVWGIQANPQAANLAVGLGTTQSAAICAGHYYHTGPAAGPCGKCGVESVVFEPIVCEEGKL